MFGDFGLLLIVGLFGASISRCDTTSFEGPNKPPTIVVGRTERSITFEWSYMVTSPDELIQISCGYWNNSKLFGMVLLTPIDNVFKVLAVQPDPSMEGRVGIDSSKKAFVIKNLQFTDERVYACRMVSLAGTSANVAHSSNSSLVIEGKPEFCSTLENNYNVTEGERLPIDVIVCANPKPSVYWKYGQTSASIPDSNVTIVPGEHRYKISHLTIPLTKDLCGTEFSCFASNQFGGNIKQSTKVFMNFKPDAPVNPSAYYYNTTCIKVAWQRPNIGDCSQNYFIDYYAKETKIGRHHLINSKVSQYVACYNLTGNRNVTTIDVIAFTSLGIMNTTTTVAFNRPPGPYAERSSSSVYVILGVVVAIVLVIFLVATLCYCKRMRKKHQAVAGQKKNGSIKSARKENGYAEEAKPVKQPTEVIYAEANKGPVVYCELGSGGGRGNTLPSDKQPLASDYCEVKTTSDYDDELDAMVPPRRKGQPLI